MFDRLYVLVTVDEEGEVNVVAASTNRDVLVNIAKEQMKEFVDENGEEFDESFFKDDGERLSYTQEGLEVSGYVIQETEIA